MSNPSPVRPALACLAALSLLTLAACTSLLPGGDPTAAPTSAERPVRVATVDPSKVTNGPVDTMSLGDVKATVLPLKRFPALAFAQESLRTRILQQAAWNGVGKVDIDMSVTSAAKGAVGLLASVLEDGQRRYAGIVYDTASNTAYTSFALIEPAKWADFVAAVKEAKNGAEVADSLADAPFPFGKAPTLAFSSVGDLLVLADTPVSVAADTVSGFLTPLGREILGGATNPSRVEPVATPSKPEAERTGAVSAGSARPAITLGPDCAKLKCVAITFDDGPAIETKDTLELLRTKKVSATFFALGSNVAQNPEVVKLAASLGNQIGWHTITHRSLPSLSNDQAEKEILSGVETIKNVIGTPPLVFRPPYGAHNKRVDELIRKAQLANIMWTVDTRDWDKSRRQDQALTDSVVRSAVGEAKPGGIVLMHDIHATTRAAVGPLVDGLLERGFTLVTVSELPGWQRFGWGRTYCSAPALGSTCW